MIPGIISLAVLKFFRNFSVPLATLQLPLTLLSAAGRRVLLEIMRCVGFIANSLAILICFIYLKNFRRHSVIVVDGYIAIFKTFAEFISATACLCYGLIEVNIYYTAVGVVGIAMGLVLKALLLYCEHHPTGRVTRATTYATSGLYVAGVSTCSFAFHTIILNAGVLPCVARIVTCILPLVALSEAFRTSGFIGRNFAYVADAVAISVLWWYCSHLSLKYFVVVPTIIGLVFSFIQYILQEIEKAASKEIETDIYLS